LNPAKNYFEKTMQQGKQKHLRIPEKLSTIAASCATLFSGRSYFQLGNKKSKALAQFKILERAASLQRIRSYQRKLV